MEVETHIKEQLGKQTYPFDVEYKIVNDEAVMTKALTFKERKEVAKGRGKGKSASG